MPSINGSNFSNIEVDFSKSMNYNNNGTSTIGGMNGDLQGDGKGKGSEHLQAITVSDDGVRYTVHMTNGNTVLLCQIAVATVCQCIRVLKNRRQLLSEHIKLR